MLLVITTLIWGLFQKFKNPYLLYQKKKTSFLTFFFQNKTLEWFRCFFGSPEMLIEAGRISFVIAPEFTSILLNRTESFWLLQNKIFLFLVPSAEPAEKNYVNLKYSYMMQHFPPEILCAIDSARWEASNKKMFFLNF